MPLRSMAPPQLICLLQVSQCPLIYSLIRQAERQELYVPKPAPPRGQLPGGISAANTLDGRSGEAQPAKGREEGPRISLEAG